MSFQVVSCSECEQMYCKKCISEYKKTHNNYCDCGNIFTERKMSKFERD